MLDAATTDGAALDSALASDGDASAPGSSDVSVGLLDSMTPVQDCLSAAGADGDGDGYVKEQDCDDCDRNINPGAYDIPSNGRDEDCSGVADDEPTGCDPTAQDSSDSAQVAARALGVCRVQRDDTWGLVKAEWVFPDGTTGSLARHGCTGGLPPHPLSRSVQTTFGDVLRPRQGTSMAVISSGIASAGMQAVPDEFYPADGVSPEGAQMCRFSAPPKGFPKNSPTCVGVTTSTQTEIADGVALELTIKVPSNAYAVSFDFIFLSTEFPRYVCSETNDQFVALLKSRHALTPADENISFDAMGNLVCVNSAFMDVCQPLTLRGRTFACPRGVGDLSGTGFAATEDEAGGSLTSGGATGWLTTTANVVPNETIRLRLALWDAGDAIADATVLLDNLRWLTAEAMKTAAPPTPPSTDRVVLF